jgi:hypothetical protein
VHSTGEAMLRRGFGRSRKRLKSFTEEKNCLKALRKTLETLESDLI